ncbi:MAG: T9SS type A sorting domain-containing protein [Porphyromonadaceae bacterium]|nr:T9SS type A sorting domain-containing protein [Porphyromonadaceae bacterium]
MFSIRKKKNSIAIFSENQLIESVEIVDFQGRKIIVKQGNFGNFIELELQNLRSGVYFLRTNSETTTFQIQ